MWYSLAFHRPSGPLLLSSHHPDGQRLWCLSTSASRVRYHSPHLLLIPSHTSCAIAAYPPGFTALPSHHLPATFLPPLPSLDDAPAMVAASPRLPPACAFACHLNTTARAFRWRGCAGGQRRTHFAATAAHTAAPPPRYYGASPSAGVAACACLPTLPLTALLLALHPTRTFTVTARCAALPPPPARPFL